MLLLNVILAVVCTYKLLMCFQQSGYNRLDIKGYNRGYVYFGMLTLLIALIGCVLDLIIRNNIAYATAGALSLLLMVYYIYLTFKDKYKKPLVFTPRVVRIIAIVGVFIIFFQFLSLTRVRSIIWGVYFLLPIFIRLAACILIPFEKFNNSRYIRRAEQRLKGNFIKIGITGSYGKTSVKNILGAILSEQYNTVITPSSYNTPLGVARATDAITSQTEIFISEMGARHKGDVSELVRLVQPEIGIVTGVNNQHAETFKGIENTAVAKYELIEGLTGRQYAVVNADNPYTLRMCEGNIKCHTAGFTAVSEFKVSDFISSESGSSFELQYGAERIRLATRLLGRHNALNIALAAAVAYELGIEAIDLKAAVYNLKPVPHRLELIRGLRGITIIDDTYNSNPDGALAALETLQGFKGRKVIVTPGLVELGELSREENKGLGEQIARVCDLVILIRSAMTDYILEGLEGYKGEQILYYDSLARATTEFSTVLRGGDVLLLLNDLPDSAGG